MPSTMPGKPGPGCRVYNSNSSIYSGYPVATVCTARLDWKIGSLIYQERGSNPRPSACRDSLSSNVRAHFKRDGLQKTATRLPPSACSRPY
ncbi:hypothetical protein FOZ62_027879 [Perkinsus olseni]|uniref:Uncharacterized protein n=1 Tax=Perkinsus olseni TaxID=32597 RepID=A0A7J6PTV2_PEROL|nr:hypothetical protein FOZ62_027879 [Perkinsus olseni]